MYRGVITGGDMKLFYAFLWISVTLTVVGGVAKCAPKQEMSAVEVYYTQTN